MAAVRKRRRQRGMSLIEVMVALGVLTVAGYGAIGLMAQTFNINRHSRQRTVSTEVARSMIDTMLGTSYVTYSREAFALALVNEPSPLAAMSCSTTPSVASLNAACTDTVRGLARKVTITETGTGTIRVRIDIGWKIRAASADRFWTTYMMEIVIP